jgi:hypothetical protein
MIFVDLFVNNSLVRFYSSEFHHQEVETTVVTHHQESVLFELRGEVKGNFKETVS